jgi:hypothetical protein
VGGALWWFLQPPSADRLYDRVRRVAEAGDSARLSDVESSIDAFLDYHSADPRAPELARYREELDLWRLERQFDLRAKRNDPTESLSPPERAYLDALRTLQVDPDAGREKLEAFVAFFGPGSDESLATRRCLQMAEARLRRLRQREAAATAEDAAVVRAQVVRARQLATTDPDEARAVLTGALELYGQRDGLDAVLAEVRAALAQLPPESAATEPAPTAATAPPAAP